MKKRKCIIYLRASTNEELQKNSFGTQRLAIERYCEEHNLHVIREYKEYVSASKPGKRHKWNEALRELRGDGNLILVAWELTRISRRLTDWSTIERLIPQLRFTNLPFAPPSFLELSLRLVIAEHETKTMGARVSAGIANRKRRIESSGGSWSWGNAHLIENASRRAGQLENVKLAQAHAFTVRQALSGMHKHTLAKKVLYLNNETDIRTRRGAKWTIGNLHRVLQTNIG